MPIDNADLNNLLVVAKDTFVDVPEEWDDHKPSFVFIPNDGSPAQVHELKHRQVDVSIQKEIPNEVAKHLIETFIHNLPRPLMPKIVMLQLTIVPCSKEEWSLDVIVDTPKALLGKWVMFPKFEKEIPPETLKKLHDFTVRLAQDASPLNGSVTQEECSMTLVYREAVTMAPHFRPSPYCPK